MKRLAACVLATTLLGVALRPITGQVATEVNLGAEQLVTSHEAPSESVAVVENGAIAFTRASGQATPDTAFAIGSITKMFTAVSIFQLVDKGAISLDDPLVKFLPSFPNAKNITVRQLLSHEAGVNNYLEAAVRDGLVYQATTSDALVALIAKGPPAFAPRTSWAYSNGGYVLLGKIVESVAHETLGSYEREHIFKPAAMVQTDVGGAATGLQFAPPFSMGAFVKFAQPDYSWYYGCGDVISTASDIARFDIALMHGDLVSASSFEMMQKVVRQHTLLGWDDGLGLFTRQFAGATIVGHHGGVPGYTADNEMVPGDGLAIVILDNGMAPTDQALFSIVNAVYGPARVVSSALPPEDFPSALTLFEHFFAGLQSGSIDKSALTPAMITALNHDAVAKYASLFGAWGAIQQVSYQREIKSDGMTTYMVQLACVKGAHLIRFTVDDGTKKLAGFHVAE